jgi:hypothetical protein
MVIAWISFTNRPADDLHGAINWIKSADPTQHYYSDGLAIQGAVTGSTYAPTSALALSVEVSKLHSSGVGVGNVTALKISSGTGTFAGSVMDQNTGKPVAFQGALLQKCDTGYGFILGSEDSTSMMLTQ